MREELNLVKDYFLIQQYRYGGSISLECEISEEALYDCLIHRFTLQPLIENALFHGIEPKGCAGKIRISANLDREAARQPRLIISVWDNGIGMDAETIKRVLSGTQKPTADFFRQVGINNVNQRIRYDCGPEYGISIEMRTGRIHMYAYYAAIRNGTGRDIMIKLLIVDDEPLVQIGIKIHAPLG